jgi:8-oxo-dGTP pyrophosphatase MutT (NUDIX family)
METKKRTKRTKEFFGKFEVSYTFNDLLRLKTNSNSKFNSWAVPCSTDAVCIKHGETTFQSYIDKERIMLSAYLYTETFIEMLEAYTDDKNTHLIVPCYFEEGKTSGNYLDVGIAINGKCKKDESFLDTMKREIAEEVGILVGEPAKKSGVSKKSIDKNLGVFYAKDCEPYSSTKNIKFSNKEDLPRKKIFSFVMGSFEECKDLVLRARELYPSDEINYGVAIIPISSVLNPNYIDSILYS